MARKKKADTVFISGVFGLGNAVEYANKWYADGYELRYCFAVVAPDEHGKDVQAIYMLGQKIFSI